MLLERHPWSALKAAVEPALELGTTGADTVQLIVLDRLAVNREGGFEDLVFD